MLKWCVQAATVFALTYGVSSAVAAPSPVPARIIYDSKKITPTIPQLQDYYAHHRYTVSQVVDWYLNRIERYNGIYRPIEEVFAKEARALAAK